MKDKFLSGGGLLFLLLCLFCFPANAFAAFHGQTIPQGVYAEGISLAGMTSVEAIETLDAYFGHISESPMTVTCMDGADEELTIGGFGFSWNSEETVRQAMSLGVSGNIIHRFKDRTDLADGSIYLNVPRQFEPEIIKDKLRSAVASHDNPAKNASIELQEDGTFKISEQGSDGVVTNLDETVKLITEQLADNLSDSMHVEVLTQEDKPKVTEDVLLSIKDELGSFTTDYSSSKDGRKTNISVAVGYLNGTVVLPGETLSVSETIRPRTEENGYELAAQYSSGESEQALGGGICQVSTTLYNALIRAELEIVERHPHSMVVTYVDWGTDAAIADNSKDLVFKNNLDYPVYIYGSADGDYLTFKIYGVEYRPANRTIEFEAKTLSEKWPKEKKVKYSDELKKGKTDVSGTRRPEVTATLTKVVYTDGQESDRILMHTDYYMASAVTITYGTR